MDLLLEAREHLSKYEKLRGNITGLNHLFSGIDTLLDILDGNYPPNQKTSARNMAITYRKDAIKAGRELLSVNNNFLSEMEALDYCQSLVDSFTNINEIIGRDSEFKLFESDVSDRKRQITETDEEITKAELIDRMLSLTQDEQKIGVALLEKLGIKNIKFTVEKEQERRLKVIFNLLPQVIIKILKEPEEKFIELIKTGVVNLTGYTVETEMIKTYLENMTSLDFTLPENESAAEIKPKPDYSIQQEKVYKYSVHNAEAKMVIRTGSYVILKDSTAIKEERYSIPKNAHKKRRELISSGALVQDQQSNLLRFVKDVPFDTPSAASNVISASSTNGWQCFGIK